jgi:Zn-dependent oligopeptidase
VYQASPQHHAWQRILELQKYLALGYTLIADELGELDQLRARFPTVAQRLAGVDGITEEDIWRLREKRREAERRGIKLDDEQIKKIKKTLIEEIRQVNLAWKRTTSDDKKPLKPWSEMARDHVRMDKLQTRSIDQKLTPAEEQELIELCRQYPYWARQPQQKSP